MRNGFNIAILLISLILILSGTFKLFGDTSTKLNKISAVIGFLLQAIYFSRMFWYKNYVQWNTNGIVIRIGSFFGKTINYKDIKTVQNDFSSLNINKKNGSTLKIGVQGIEKTDVEKLHHLITSHVSAQNNYSDKTI